MGKPKKQGNQKVSKAKTNRKKTTKKEEKWEPPKLKKWDPSPISSQSAEDLKEIAIQIHRGNIYTSLFHDRGLDSFMIFKLWLSQEMSETDVTEAQMTEYVGTIGTIYEYMDQAGPLSVNGRPSFLSMKLLNVEDTEIVREHLIKLEEAEKDL